MRNICNVRMPHAMGDVISGIGISIAAANSIGHRATARYRSSPRIMWLCCDCLVGDDINLQGWCGIFTSTAKNLQGQLPMTPASSTTCMLFLGC